MAPAPPLRPPRCLGLLAGGAPTRRDARFCMFRVNASMSGMGMWPGAYLLKWSSDALWQRRGEGGSCVLCCAVMYDV